MADVDLTAIDEVHDLYRIDPSEFVEARAALVKQLRTEKRADEARAVVKLRKPTASSWALDQVAHDRPELIEAALAAGDELEAATAQTLDGDASNLRAATDAERAASAAVIDAAADHLALNADLRERVAATLRAAITDDEVRVQLQAGLLAADHEPPPMGFAAPGGPLSDATGAGSANPARRTQKGAAEAELAAAPAEDDDRSSSKRKIRRVGTPSSAKRRPVDEVDAKRKAKEVERLQAEELERRRAEAEREKERKKLQAALDGAAKKARTTADRLDEKARKAEEAAATARSEADAALAEAARAEAAATAGPPETGPEPGSGPGSGSDVTPSGSRSGRRVGSGPAIRTRPKAPGRR